MLVLTRKVRESVILEDLTTGELVKVKVTRMDDRSIRLGFEASQNIRILREELYLAQQAGAQKSAEAAQQAAETSPEDVGVLSGSTTPNLPAVVSVELPSESQAAKPV